MIFKNILFFLFISLLNILNIESYRLIRNISVRGKIDCRNRHAKYITVSLCQKTLFRYTTCLKTVSSSCESTFFVYGKKCKHSKSDPFILLKYEYTQGCMHCKVKSSFKIPQLYLHQPNYKRNDYFVGIINLLKPLGEKKKCYLLKRKCKSSKKWE